MDTPIKHDTKIQWTHVPGGYKGDSWNPWHAKLKDEYAIALDQQPPRKGWYCEKVKQPDGKLRLGCAHCYAAAFNMRLGTGLDYHASNRDKVELTLDQLDLPRRKRRPHAWFVDSMTDMFLEAYPDAEIKAVIDEMIAVKRHIYIVLSKRHERMNDYLQANYPDMKQHRHIWWGVSIENQETANAALPYLASTPAWIRVVSYEPAVGPVDWDKALRVQDKSPDWILIGGESQQGRAAAQPFNLEWARDTILWCRMNGVTPFVKQLGSLPVTQRVGNMTLPYQIKDSHGSDPDEWPEDLRVREFPDTEGMTVAP